MSKSQLKAALASLLILATCSFQACKTEDVEDLVPGKDISKASLSASKLVMSEEADSIEVIATLNVASLAQVEVELVLTGTAQGNGVDYILSSNKILIAAGATNGSTWIHSAQDTSKESNESIVCSILSVAGGVSDGVQTLNIIIEDDDVPQTPNLLINEICYDPSNSALEGDANGDGTYTQKDDEFVELINMSSKSIDLAGYKVYDTESLLAGTPTHVFPPNSVIAPGKALVLFGGGTPTGSFGGSVVQISSSGDLNLNNAGDILTLTDANGTVIVSIDIAPFSDNPNESYTRNPDITGSFEQHGSNTPILFSPGTKIDGTSF